MLKALNFRAYIRIAKSCPPQIWEPRILVKMLCSQSPCVPLIECIRVAIDILCSNGTPEDKDDDNIGMPLASSKECYLPKIGEKRLTEIDMKAQSSPQHIVSSRPSLVMDGSCSRMMTHSMTDADSGSCIYPRYADLLELLKLPWANNSAITQACLLGKAKCLCIQSVLKDQH